MTVIEGACIFYDLTSQFPFGDCGIILYTCFSSLTIQVICPEWRIEISSIKDFVYWCENIWGPGERERRTFDSQIFSLPDQRSSRLQGVRRDFKLEATVEEGIWPQRDDIPAPSQSLQVCWSQLGLFMVFVCMRLFPAPSSVTSRCSLKQRVVGIFTPQTLSSTTNHVTTMTDGG